MRKETLKSLQTTQTTTHPHRRNLTARFLRRCRGANAAPDPAPTIPVSLGKFLQSSESPCPGQCMGSTLSVSTSWG